MPIPSLLDLNSSPSVLPAAVGGLPPLPQLSSAPASAPATPDSIAGPSAIPQLPSGGLRPLVTSPRQQQEEQLQQSLLPKPGQPGFWHALGRVASKIGNVAGDIVDPGAMALIPGTDLNRVMQHNSNQKLLGDLQKQDQDEQDAASKRNLEGAQAAGAENGKVTPLATDQGYVSFNGSTGQVTPLNDQSGQQLQPKDKQTPESVHVLPDGKVVSISKDANGKPQATIVYQGDPSVKTEVKQLQIGGKPHQVLINSQSGEQIKDLGETGERPPTINLNGDRKQLNAETQKEYNSTYKDLNGQFSAAQTQLESISEAQSLINSGAVGQALGTVKTMVGIAGGKGSGVRITQAELNSIANARGVQGSFEGWLNGLEGKGKYSQQQIQQVGSILQEVASKLQEKRQGLDDTLDKLGQAASPQEIRQIQSDYRKSTMAPQQSGGTGQVFDAKAWSAANPKGDVNKAIAKAKSLGHQVKQ